MGPFKVTIIFLLSSLLLVTAESNDTENLFSKMNKNMTESEIRTSFVVWDNETVNEYEIVQVYHRIESKDKVIIELSTFGKNYTFDLEPTLGLLKSDGYLPIFEISKDGVLREITEEVAEIGKPYFDNKNSASMMLTFDKNKNVLTEGYIGSELIIRPLRNASLYSTVDDGKKSNIVNYPHLILKKPPQLKRFTYDSLKNDDDTKPEANRPEIRTKKGTDELNADLEPSITGSDSGDSKDSENRRSKRQFYVPMNQYIIPVFQGPPPGPYPGTFYGPPPGSYPRTYPGIFSGPIPRSYPRTYPGPFSGPLPGPFPGVQSEGVLVVYPGGFPGVRPGGFPKYYPGGNPSGNPGGYLRINPYLIPREHQTGNPNFDPTSIFRSNSWKPSRDTAIVEVLLYTDYSIYQFYGEDTAAIRRYYTSFMNSVSQTFKSLDNPNIEIRISGIVISTDVNETPFITNDGYNKFDGSEAINQMAHFTNNHHNELLPHDIIIAVTKLDMTENYDSRTLGIAMVGGACQRGNNVGIVEDSRNKGVETAAHEIGHLLGSQHDDGYNGCQPNEQYRMAPTAGPSRYQKEWSPCSQKSFTTFLRSPLAFCLYQESGRSRKIPESTPNEMYPDDPRDTEEGCEK